MSVVATVSLLATLLILSLYFFTFAPKSGYTFSGQNQDWAQFGDYLAGTLGTVFSLLAFVGVLFTIWFQARQLDLASNQANLEEIQRTLANIATRLDQLIHQPIAKKYHQGKNQEVDVTFYLSLAAGGTAALRQTSDDWLVQFGTDQVLKHSKADLQFPSTVVAIELDQLAWCIDRYRSQGGSIDVIEFYIRRYGPIVCWLDILELLPGCLNAQRVFDPSSRRSSLAS